MKIVLVHSVYRQRGGEEEVFRAEAELLRQHGHEVVEFTAENESMVQLGPVGRVATTVWNRGAHRDLRRVLAETRPDVAHFHNTFPFLSPSVLHAASAEGVPVVQTLHNYRLICANGLHFRDGRICEECAGKAVPWPAVAHACYRGSRAASAVVAGMLTAHRAAGTWREKVDRYIALTEFARRKLVAAGLPADRTVVKPNFVPDPGAGAAEREDFALFVGRLTPEKGVDTMLAAWEQSPGPRLVVVGEGPMKAAAEARAGRAGNVEVVGRKDQGEVLALMKRARVLIFPSEWYEGMPRVVLEAFACGLPVIAAAVGAVTEFAGEGETGFFFEPGNAADLAASVRRAVADDRLAAMGAAARRVFEERYTGAANVRRLEEIYEEAIGRRGAGDRLAV